MCAVSSCYFLKAVLLFVFRFHSFFFGRPLVLDLSLLDGMGGSLVDVLRIPVLANNYTKVVNQNSRDQSRYVTFRLRSRDELVGVEFKVVVMITNYKKLKKACKDMPESFLFGCVTQINPKTFVILDMNECSVFSCDYCVSLHTIKVSYPVQQFGGEIVRHHQRSGVLAFI